MATKTEELLLVQSGRGALGRAHADEPIFILRAQDVLAPGIVEAWATALITRNNFDGNGLERVSAKVGEALKLANDMRDWQRAHHSKVPD